MDIEDRRWLAASEALILADAVPIRASARMLLL
jgi:hypothetical protein